MVLSGVVNILWSIWFSRNQVRFENKSVYISDAINLALANIALSGNLSSGTILQKLSVSYRVDKAPLIKEIIWNSPSYNWIKCNLDGGSKGAPGVAACVGIFRDKNAASLGCFALNIGCSYALHAELFGAIFAIGTTYKKGWKRL